MVPADIDVAPSPQAASSGRGAGCSRVHRPHKDLIREAAPTETAASAEGLQRTRDVNKLSALIISVKT